MSKNNTVSKKTFITVLVLVGIAAAALGVLTVALLKMYVL